MDPYLLLEVPYTATIGDIKKAYRELAKKWHPDRNGGSKDAEEKFKCIQAAYDCLIDPIRRAAVDLERNRRIEQVESAKRVAAEQQARAATRAQQSTVHPEGPNWGAVALSILALVGIGAALSQRTAPRKRPQTTKRKRRRTY